MQAPASTSQNVAPVLAPAARTAPTATEMYEAARLMQRELRNQRNALDGQRRELQQQMENNTNPADVKGIEARLAALDARQADVDKQLAAADAQVAPPRRFPASWSRSVPRVLTFRRKPLSSAGWAWRWCF